MHQPIRVVCRNNAAHKSLKKASLYEAFPAEEAKRLADRLELHFTPVHGSWLNICEIELSVLGKQCLNRRIESIGNDHIGGQKMTRTIQYI